MGDTLFYLAAAPGGWHRARYLLAAKVSVNAVLAALGVISIAFAGLRLWSARGGRVAAPHDAPAILGALLGVATFAGVWLVRRVNAEKFYTLIYVLMILVGVQLLWEATLR